MQNPFNQIISSTVRKELSFPLQNAGLIQHDIDFKVQEMAHETLH